MTVYFVETSASSPVKIGTTTDMYGRLSGLQTSTHERMSVIEEFPGDRHTEKAIHEALADARLCGEWFGGTAARGFLADARSIGMRAAIAQWRTRRDEALADGRAEIASAVAAFMDVIRDAFSAFAERVGKDAAKRTFNIGDVKFEQRKLSVEQAFQLFLLSDSETREKIKTAAELVCLRPVFELMDGQPPLPKVLTSIPAQEDPQDERKRLVKRLAELEGVL